MYQVGAPANVSNIPSTQAGFLKVTHARSYIYQEYYECTSPYAVYQRCSVNSGSSWSAWIQTDSTETGTVTVASGKTLSTNRTVKAGRIASINVGITGSQLSDDDYTVIGSVSGAMRPLMEVTAPMIFGGSGAYGFIRIRTSGEISLYKKGSSTATLYAYVSYPV